MVDEFAGQSGGGASNGPWLQVNPASGILDSQTRRILRALRAKVIGLPCRWHARKGASTGRLSSLFGNPKLLGLSLPFWKNRIDRLYHKSFRYLSLFLRQLLPNFGFTKEREKFSIPTMDITSNEVPVTTLGNVEGPKVGRVVNEPSAVTEVTMEPPAPPWMASLPFFTLKTLPSEEPWWVSGGLPPSKEAFVDHFYGPENRALHGDTVGRWMRQLTLPGKDRVTVCLSAHELNTFSGIISNLSDGATKLELVTPLFGLRLKGPFARLLYPSRLHICNHPHTGCNRHNLSVFLNRNPWSNWHQLLIDERNHQIAMALEPPSRMERADPLQQTSVWDRWAPTVL